MDSPFIFVECNDITHPFNQNGVNKDTMKQFLSFFFDSDLFLRIVGLESLYYMFFIWIHLIIMFKNHRINTEHLFIIPSKYIKKILKLLICHSGLGTKNTVSQRIQTDNHKIGKMVLQWHCLQ